MKKILSTSFIFIGILALTVSFVHADERPEGTTCEVDGVTIECDDTNITDAHNPNCAFLHYHGELDGASDPDEYGCGHGIVESVAPEEDTEPSAWDTFTDWADALFQGISGGFSPKTVSETVDIVEENSESLAETAEMAEEYFDTYEDAPDRDRYTLEGEDVEETPVPWIYKAFWSLFE